MKIVESSSRTFRFEVIGTNELPAAAEFQRLVNACECDITRSQDWVTISIAKRREEIERKYAVQILCLF